MPVLLTRAQFVGLQEVYAIRRLIHPGCKLLLFIHDKQKFRFVFVYGVKSDRI